MSETSFGVYLTAKGPQNITLDQFAKLDPMQKLRVNFNQVGYSTEGFTPYADRDLLGIPSFAYRADSKEEFAFDLGVGIAKVGFAVASGGTSAGAKTALGYVVSLLS